MLYRSISSAIWKQHMQKKLVLLRQGYLSKCVIIRKYKIRNVYIHKQLGIIPIEYRMVENHLRW